VPEDLSLLVAKCAFCGEQVPLPVNMIATRQAQLRAAEADRTARTVGAVQGAARTAGRWVFWTVMLTTVVPVLLAIVGGVVVLIVNGVKSTNASPNGGTTAAPAPEPVAAPPATDPVSTGESRATEMVKGLYARGCKNVVFPPQRMQGDQTLQTKFVLNGTCVRVIAVTGVAANRLTLTMKTPFGETIETPPPSTELDFTYCPKTEGPHPTQITPATEAYYTVGALECPSHLRR
jgi:hypothetical protein